MALSGSWVANAGNKYIDATISWSGTQSITGNYTDVTATVTYSRTNTGYTTEGTWSGTLTIDGTAKSDSKKVVVSYNSNTTVISNTVRIYHNGDGSKSITISVSGSLRDRSLNTSNSFTLDTIPRYAYLIDGMNFNDTENPTIYYSNPAGSAIAGVIGVIFYDGIEIKRELDRSASSGVFNLTEAERNDLRLHCANSKSMTVLFRIGSRFSGESDYHWSSQYRTFTVVNAEPTLAPTLKITDALTKNLTGKTDTIIRSVSNVSFTDGLQVYKYTTPRDRYASNSSQRIDGGYGTFNKVESDSFYFYASDNRGYVTTKTVKMPIVNYVPLSCNITTIQTKLAGGTTATIHFEVGGTYYNGSFGKVDNTITLKYRYKKGVEDYGMWQTFYAVPQEGGYTASMDITGLDYKGNYTVQVSATDEVSAEVLSAEKTTSASPIFVIEKDAVNFNVPLKMHGNKMDVVIAHGFTNGWEWRKWESGIAECWRIYDYTVKLKSRHQDSWVVVNWGFPFTFKQIPLINASIANVTNWTHYLVRTSYNQSQFIEFCCAMSTTHDVESSATGTLSVHVIGQYK